MIAIRVIIEVIIFIYMMGLSIGLRKQKIKKTQRIKMIRIFLTIMFLVVVPYSACIPVENFFITFNVLQTHLLMTLYYCTFDTKRIIRGYV